MNRREREVVAVADPAELGLADCIRRVIWLWGGIAIAVAWRCMS